MAEAVLFNVAEGILKILGSGAIQEIGLWWNVEDELEKLKDTMKTIQAVLLDAEEQYSSSNQVQLWLGQLKEAVYETDDLLDDFSTKALQRQAMTGNRMGKKVRSFFSSSNRIACGLKMAHKIKDMRGRLDEIAANRRFHLQERLVDSDVMANDREETHSSLPENIIGRDDDKKQIVELLLSSMFDENLSVIAIVGIGGLGKTTLAQFVYNDERVGDHFELKLWVCVSDNFNVKSIAEKILESVTNLKHRDLEMNTLKNLLHEKLGGKKYLLVLDDVWNENPERWFRLKDLLLGGALGSRVIVTTRLKRAAEITRPSSIYELSGLSETESWNLFKQMAFRKGQIISPSHEAVGREIAEKCVGVPLAIKTIGALLYFKDSEDEWHSFRVNEFSRVVLQESDILPTLKLSYNHLPSHLKTCFAYCRLFPKDYVIHVPTLISLWMAQGYINPSDPRQSLEDIGLKYFVDLSWRSFFQEVRKDAWGNIETCKMHDLMHDLAILVAGGESASLDSDSGYVDEKTRHVFFNLDVDSVSPWCASPSLLKTSKLRTFLAEADTICPVEEGQMHLMFTKLKRLRVLDLHLFSFETLPNSIDKLKHLRYLSLSGNQSIRILPDSISELQNLQLLKLVLCKKLKQLPRGITKLIQLRQLDIKGCRSLTHIPIGLQRMTSLQVLSRFVVANDESSFKQSSGLRDLHGLNNLTGWLEIVNLKYVENTALEFKAANLKEKKNLQRLTLEWDNEDEFNILARNDDADENDIEDNDDETASEALQPHVNLKELYMKGFRGLKFPRWLSSLRNLVSLKFYHCRKCRLLPPLDQFPSLKDLSVTRLTSLEYIDDRGSATFLPSLETVKLSKCPSLKGWWRMRVSSSTSTTMADLPQFHSLSRLIIEACPNLTALPQLTSSLKFLRLSESGMKFLRQMMRMAVSIEEQDIQRIYDLEFLPEDSLQNLTRIRKLSIILCQRLMTIPLAYLTSLEHLTIVACDELDVFDDENDYQIQWQSLRKLRSLLIEDIASLTSIPHGLQYVTTLSRLRISCCHEMMMLPQWMENLSCLQNLDIAYCPQLSERCNNNMAADWPLIAHIPNIMVECKKIQWNGCYRQ